MLTDTPERIGRELANGTRRRPAFGKRRIGSGKAHAEVVDFARAVAASNRRTAGDHHVRHWIMIGLLTMGAAAFSPFLYSAVNTAQMASADLGTMTVEDVANFVTAAGGASPQDGDGAR